jgi:hypothetical protein
MGCESSKVCCGNGSGSAESVLPASALDCVSMRRSEDVEEFFKKAYQYGNHMEALKDFMANDAARLKLLEFLEVVYYAKAPESYQVEWFAVTV